MIHLPNDPQRPHRHAASMQLSIVTTHVLKMSAALGPDRLYLLELIRPCFVALRWLQAEKFAEVPRLGELLDETERVVQELAHLGEGQVNWTGGHGPQARCPCCGKKLEADPVDSILACPGCTRESVTVLNRLGSNFEGFGTSAV